MKSRTVTMVSPAPKAQVFGYLSRSRTSLSATDFAKELKVVDGRHKVVNGLGEFFLRIEADERTGVIDMLAGPTETERSSPPCR